ncbi:MAG: zinc-binding dehydrogenase [Planctomycetota bacterium]
MKIKAVTVTGREQAALTTIAHDKPLGPNDVLGRTLVSLVSPGTELNWNYLGTQFPTHPGYACVFRVDKVGAGVKQVKAGDTVFAMGGHRSVQQCDAGNVVVVPKGLKPEEAVIARLMGVTMATLKTAVARPGDMVIVAGAGPVGYLGAHLFAKAGYDVRVVEPDAGRRALVKKSGIATVYPAIPFDDPAVKGKVALVVECSGHEQAVLDACKIVRKRGEVVMVGVPWKRRTDLYAFDLLHAVFHQYTVLRSGWEWEVPNQSTDFQPHSIFSGFRLALRWLAEGRIPVRGHITRNDPRKAQAVYQDLIHSRAKGLFQEFDWRLGRRSAR